MFGGSVFWILVFGVPIVAIVSNAFVRASRYKALREFAERGQPIPPELAKVDTNSPLRSGLVLTFLGIGLVLFFWAMTGARGWTGAEWLPAIGLIPLSIGIALLVSHRLERNK